jgi:retron-type reverse transcriptase
VPSGDIYRYFPAIDHAILKRDLRRRVACERTLWLADAIIDGSNPQEPVHIHYPGDDMLAPVQRRRGLPLGNLTSQLFANIYLDGLDHFCTEVLRPNGYLRYVDDFALFHDRPSVLEEWRQRIAVYLAGRRLLLHPPQDDDPRDRRIRDLPRVRAVAARAAVAGGQRATLPQPLARPA